MSLDLDKPYNLILGDCLEVMPGIEAGSADAIIADWPYGVTQNSWDSVIPLKTLWEQCKRIIKSRGAIVLTATPPFNYTLWESNRDWYKYEWTWDKQGTANFALAKYQPLRAIEVVMVFGKGKVNYYPQMRQGKLRGKGGGGKCSINGISPTYTVNDQYYPTNVIRISNANFPGRGLHPSQKPAELMEYLIKTYTNPGDLVLDNTMGSGSTGEACLRTGRRFIGIEKDPGYFEIAQNRLEKVERELRGEQLEMAI